MLWLVLYSSISTQVPSSFFYKSKSLTMPTKSAASKPRVSTAAPLSVSKKRKQATALTDSDIESVQATEPPPSPSEAQQSEEEEIVEVPKVSEKPVSTFRGPRSKVGKSAAPQKQKIKQSNKESTKRPSKKPPPPKNKAIPKNKPNPKRARVESTDDEEEPPGFIYI